MQFKVLLYIKYSSSIIFSLNSTIDPFNEYNILPLQYHFLFIGKVWLFFNSQGILHIFPFLLIGTLNLQMDCDK